MLKTVDLKLLEHEVTLRQDEHYLIRPFRKEDEAALRDMFKRSTSEDIYFRIFAAMKDFPDRMAERFAQIDLESEMALIATRPFSHPSSEIFGIAHVAANPAALETAEFDIMVRPDYKGHGIGYQLMTEILRYAELRGHSTVIGYILFENHAMLKMARELGFVTFGMEGDAAKVQIKLPRQEPVA
jgi:acetyltransferase